MKPGWSKPHTHSSTTNLALFRHKITLYRFNQGAHTIAGGSNGSRGAEPPELPFTLTTASLPSSPLPYVLPHPLPCHQSPFPSPPLEVDTLNPARGSGGAPYAPQRGLGEMTFVVNPL